MANLLWWEIFAPLAGVVWIAVLVGLLAIGYRIVGKLLRSRESGR
jgi:hypothetical protein